MRRTGLCALLLLLGLAALPAWAAPARVLVISSAAATAKPAQDWTIPALVSLLGHFDATITTVTAATYHAGQAGKADAVFYLGADKEPLPAVLLADLYDSNHPVCWIGGNLEQLAARYSLGRFGFGLTTLRTPERYRTVRYRSASLPRPAGPLVGLRLDAGGPAEALATADGPEGATTPYLVRSGRFWYVADLALTGLDQPGAWLALADQLHQILGQEHPARRTASVCLIDINPMSDGKNLRNLIRTLEGRKVPVTLAVTPLYRNPRRNQEVRLLEQDGLVAVLIQAQAHGATVLVDGLTHQSASETGTEPEFWDGRRHRPLVERDSEDTHRRIDQAINELAACGLYPVGWTTPQGSASPADYAEVKRSFTTVWERRYPSATAPGPQVFPFPLRRDQYGQHLLPENTSRLTDSASVDVLRAQAKALAAIADPWLGLAVSSNASPRELDGLVEELRGDGWQFADLRRMDNRVESTPLMLHTRERSTRLSSLVPARWGASLVVLGKDKLQPVQLSKGSELTLTSASVLVTYPPGVSLENAYNPRGPVARAAHTGLQTVTRAVTFFAIAACGLFLAIYLAEIILQRRRA